MDTRHAAAWYSPRTISGIYALVLVIVIFSAIQPRNFLTISTASTVLNQSAINGLVSLALVMPLAAGVFDVSVGYVLGLTGVVAGWLLGNTGLPVWTVILVSLAAGCGMGLVNAFVNVVLGVESIIATLGTGSIFYAASIALTGDTPLVKGITGDFSTVTATASFHGLTVPVFFFLAATLLLAWITEHTQTGRFMYALGFDADVARLSGLRVSGLRVIAFTVAGLVAAIAGLALTGYVATASPEVGSSYLLPAFAGVFLGATQVRHGRFNAWGTLIAVLLLGTGDEGLLLIGGPPWLPEVFQGVMLIVAVAIRGVGNRRADELLRRMRRRWSRAAASADAVAAGEDDAQSVQAESPVQG